jgi:hypothetical protein
MRRDVHDVMENGTMNFVWSNVVVLRASLQASGESVAAMFAAEQRSEKPRP